MGIGAVVPPPWPWRMRAAWPKGFAERRDAVIAASSLAVVLLAVFLLVNMAMRMAALDVEYTMDFQVFHKVGELIWSGKLSKAYDLQTFRAIEAVATGNPHGLTSWAYPPQFDLVAAVLGLGGLVSTYVMFMAATFAGYVLVLRRLGERRMGWAMAFGFPAMIVSVAAGQNGFLTAALAGAFALGFMKRDARAGIPLGLLVIKPHLAVALAFLALVQRRYDVLAYAAAAVLASAALATLALGWEVWPAFFHGAREASHYLRIGRFPLYRMTSLFAALVTLKVPAAMAMVLQLGVAVLGLYTLWRQHRAGAGPEVLLGLSMLATLLVSPYVYDYDMPIFALGLALLAPELARNLRPAETLVMLAASWTVCGWGVTENKFLAAHNIAITINPDNPPLSVAGLIYPALFFLIARVVTRPAVPAEGRAEGLEALARRI